MEFLKNFFGDDSTIIGLCGFNSKKPAYNEKSYVRTRFIKTLKLEKSFSTNFAKNVLL